MARGVNKVILIGNLGDEPSYRQTSSGTAVVNISMVTNEMRRSMDTQQVTEFAEWHRVVMWGKLAEIAHQWLHKGSQIYVEGKLRTRSYTDKQNVKRTITEIVADEMQMLGGKNNSFQNDGQQASSAPSYQSAQPYQGGQQFRSDSNTQSAPAQQSPYGNSTMQNASPYGASQTQPVQNQQSVYGQQNSFSQNGYQGGSGFSQAAPQATEPQQPKEPNMFEATSSTVDGADDDLPF